MRPLDPAKPAGKGGCTGHLKGSKPPKLCDRPAFSGTDKCKLHAGKSALAAAHEGRVRVEAAYWSLPDTVNADPAEFLLRLVTQRSLRVRTYSAAVAAGHVSLVEVLTADPTAAHLDPTRAENVRRGEEQIAPDLAAATSRLNQVFTTGDVGALVGIYQPWVPGMGLSMIKGALEQLRDLEEREIRLAAHLAMTAVNAGLAKTQDAVLHQVSGMLATAVQSILDDLGLGDDPHAMQVVSTRLLAVAGG